MNNSCIPKNAYLICFDIVNIFPSIHKESGIQSVERLLIYLQCLECNNSTFNDKFYLQTDDSQGPHMFFYSDIAMYHLLKPLIWKRFCDDLIGLWILDYLKTIDASGKIKFTKEIENENDLAFLDLILKLSGCKKSQ